MDGTCRGQSKETWRLAAASLSQQTAARFIAVHGVCMSSHEDRAKAAPNA